MSLSSLTIQENTKALTPDQLSPCSLLRLPASLPAPSDEVLAILASWPDLTVEVYGEGASLCLRDGFLLSEKGTRLLFAPRNRPHLTLPEGVCSIAPSAFAGLTVSSLHFPSTLEILEGPEPREETFSDSFDPEEEDDDPLSPSPFGAFEACENLTQLQFPPSLKLIGPNAFADCASLSRLSFSEGLLGIRENAFTECGGLKELTLPASLAYVESNAFCACRSLEKVCFAGSSVSLSFGAFSGCYALREVRLADYCLPREDLDYLLGLSVQTDAEEDFFGDQDLDEDRFWMD